MQIHFKTQLFMLEAIIIRKLVQKVRMQVTDQNSIIKIANFNEKVCPKKSVSKRIITIIMKNLFFFCNIFSLKRAIFIVEFKSVTDILSLCLNEINYLNLKKISSTLRVYTLLLKNLKSSHRVGAKYSP